MKIVRVTRFGGPEVLQISDTPAPRPDRGQVLVAVEAAGVGFVDVMARQGSYGPVAKPGYIPGVEVAGTIVDVGPEVDATWRDRRVFAICLAGGYAEQVAVDFERVVELPDALSSAQAVALGVNAMVAWFGLDRAGLGRGKSVLVRGASGGIGLMATQIAAYAGAIVSAVTSSAARGDRLIELGASHIINRNLGEARDASGYDMVIDTVGGENISDFVSKLNANGHYVLCGGAAGAPSIDFGKTMLERFHSSLSFTCFSLNSVEPKAWRHTMAELFRLTVEKRIKALVDGELNLSQAAEAHRRMEAGEVFGKLVLVP